MASRARTQARTGFEAVKAWLAWTSCELRQGLRYSDEALPIKWFDRPPPDGEMLRGATGFVEHGPVIYPAGKRVAMMSVGTGHVVIGVQGTRILEIMSQASAAGVTSVGKELRVGLDLYHAASWEISNYARFLTLVNVLEVLKEQPDRSQAVQELVDKWLEDLDTAEESGTVGPDVAKSLRTSLGFLRKRSIRASVRALVHENLSDVRRASEAARMYDERSSLVHEGSAPAALGERVASLDGIISSLLHVLVRRR
ncbi:MAG TPA: hypothetical protein VF711_06935 [Acidimicrobiales bacterium]|jgi:hypothetical protein